VEACTSWSERLLALLPSARGAAGLVARRLAFTIEPAFCSADPPDYFGFQLGGHRA
jgi:hypothetical protein